MLALFGSRRVTKTKGELCCTGNYLDIKTENSTCVDQEIEIGYLVPPRLVPAKVPVRTSELTWGYSLTPRILHMKLTKKEKVGQSYKSSLEVLILS